MSGFIQLEASQPATLGTVVEAVTRISTSDEAKILELVSAGKIKDLFPFQPAQDEIPPDTVEDSELVEASAMPLNRERRGALIQSSMPASSARSVKLKVSTPKKPYSEG